MRKALVRMAAFLMAGLLPFSAFQNTLRAESGNNDNSGKEIRSGTDHITGAMESNIYFGNYWQSVKSEDAADSNKEPVKWRVLANDGSLFVVSDKNLDCIEYNSSAETVTWENCSLRKWLNGKFLVGFPTDWKAKGGTRVALNTEYTRSKRAMTSSDMSGAWWLRTPGDAKNAANVFNAGNVFVRGGNVNNFIFAVRPAMNIDTSKVLFTSPAEGGKTSGEPGPDAMKEVGSYTGSDWKLTIKDDTRPVFEASVSGPKTILKDGAVKLRYKGASTGENEYISALIEDNDGNILYYGNIAGSTSADAKDSGKAAINVPAELTPGNYTLKVFSEQCNGDFKTDLASNIVTLDITISKYKTADRNLLIGISSAIVTAALVTVVFAVRKKKHA